MYDTENYGEWNSETTITGPHPEYDRYGQFTGVYYVRCPGCGIEALRREHVREQCQCGEQR
jgi:hypothetical protein